jgi:hypothetical protein
MKEQVGYVKTGLRVPPELHKRLHEAAHSSHRTFNGEILFRLEESFSEVEKGNAPAAETVEALGLTQDQL